MKRLKYCNTGRRWQTRRQVANLYAIADHKRSPPEDEGLADQVRHWVLQRDGQTG